MTAELLLECRLTGSDFIPVLGVKDYADRTSHITKRDPETIMPVMNRKYVLAIYNLATTAVAVYTLYATLFR